MHSCNPLLEPVLPIDMEAEFTRFPEPLADSVGTNGLGDPTVLVVDDEEGFRDVLLDILQRGGYKDVLVASSCAEALQVINAQAVDVVLTDLVMGDGSGLQLLAHLQQTSPHIATLLITATDDTALAEQALTAGAFGYFVKPFRHSEVLCGVSNALRRRTLALENQGYREHLEHQVKIRTADLWVALQELATSEKDVRRSRAETIERLATAAEFRDEETGQHVMRMSRYCEALARAAGVKLILQQSIREAASLHDIGKIGVPDSILLKPAALSPEERLVMQQHAEIGHRILGGSDAPLLELAAEIALTHHEKVDGTGYPKGLVGAAIPLSGRIAAIADVFDALMTQRVYRKRSFELVEVIDMMKEGSGKHFDSELLARFLEILPEILRITDAFQAEPTVR